MSEIRTPGATKKAASPQFTLCLREFPIVFMVTVAETVEAVAKQYKNVTESPESGVSDGFIVGDKSTVSLDHMLMVSREEGVIYD